MDRRAFIGSVALGALASRAASAQPARKVARIGIVGFAGTTSEMSGPEPTRPSVKALLQGLRELGYVYGRDFVTEPRGGEGRPELWPGLVAEIVGLQVDHHRRPRSDDGDAQAGHDNDPDRHGRGIRPDR